MGSLRIWLAFIIVLLYISYAEGGTDTMPSPVVEYWVYNMTNSSLISPNAMVPATKIMGVGWGAFICMFVGGVLVVFSLSFSMHDLAGLIYFASAILMALIVVLLNYLPKAPVGSVPDSVLVFDLTYYPRIALILLLLLGSVAGLGGVFAFYVLIPVYAINPDA
ncbi:hypothetical protein BDR26DRAFT_856289 [Obelidium mucronatum]|nr:hypothetical protein BDR26DRAFT_856289 [Obelidium mucronatum]